MWSPLPPRSLERIIRREMRQAKLPARGGDSCGLLWAYKWCSRALSSLSGGRPKTGAWSCEELGAWSYEISRAEEEPPSRPLFSRARACPCPRRLCYEKLMPAAHAVVLGPEAPPPRLCTAQLRPVRRAQAAGGNRRYRSIRPTQRTGS